MNPKLSGSPKTGFASVKTYAKPLATFIIAIVAIKGGTFNFAIQNPLIAPQIVPITREVKIIIRMDIGTDAFGMVFTRDAPATPAMAATDPTERSIPSDKMVKVIPQAIKALMEI